MLIDTNTPDNALNGKYRFRINEHWLGQLSSYYSFSDHEFDSAQVSATKLMNGYAITFSYEFVRNSPMVSFEFRGKDYYNKGRKVEPDNDVLRWPITSQDKF